MISLAIAAGVIAVLMVGCWLVSLRLADASVVDPLWPMLFVAVVWAFWLSSGGGAGRKLALVAMVTLWGLRLGIHLGLRKWGEPEDFRYVAMRRRWQPFELWSLVIVFGLQGVLATVISLPLVAVVGAEASSGVGWLAWVGIAVWAAGLLCETVADRQLKRFRAEPANRGEVLDRGLWRYSRHPNYFGDFLVWWGIWLVAAAAGAWWTVVGPFVMSILLLRVSGVTLLERTIVERRPGYAEYVARTSAFVPLPPRRSRPSGAADSGA